MNITLSYEPMTVIFKNGETASFERVLNVKQCTNSDYIIYFICDGLTNNDICHITYTDVACVVSGLVDVLF